MAVSELNEAVLKAISEHLPAIQMEQLREQLNRIPELEKQIIKLETELKESRTAADRWQSACTRLQTDLAQHGAIEDGERLLERDRQELALAQHEHALKVAKHEGRAEALDKGFQMLQTIFQQVAVPTRNFSINGAMPVAGQHGYPEQGNVSLSGTVDG